MAPLPVRMRKGPVMSRWALVCVDRTGRPFFVVDEAGEPAVFASFDEAESVACSTPVCLSLGWSTVELPREPS
jgi:hypothetical protein